MRDSYSRHSCLTEPRSPDLEGEGKSSSCSVGSLLTSTGLHSPKSDSFMCPLASSSRLSGLMSLHKWGSCSFSPAYGRKTTV